VRIGCFCSQTLHTAAGPVMVLHAIRRTVCQRVRNPAGPDSRVGYPTDLPAPHPAHALSGVATAVSAPRGG
jgi:hypothetical protein